MYGGGRKGEYREQTTPVDTFEANPWGLHDMHGNVWEWVEDCFNDSYRGAPTDGSAWFQGNCSGRVARGGSWDSGPWDLRSEFRSWGVPDDRYNYLGFRVSRALAARSATSPGKNTNWSRREYHDPALAGLVTFNYSNNNGRYSIELDEFF